VLFFCCVICEENITLYCSTHGDEALVGRVTVNAIFFGDTYCGVPFFVVSLHCQKSRFYDAAVKHRRKGREQLGCYSLFYFVDLWKNLFYDKGRIVRKAELVS
jgi:hypothetical protein